MCKVTAQLREVKKRGEHKGQSVKSTTKFLWGQRDGLATNSDIHVYKAMRRLTAAL